MPNTHVLHVTEASLGGLRRHLDDVMRGLHNLGVQQSLVYSPARADSGMRALVTWCRAEGIETCELAMPRSIRPIDDARAALALRRTIRQLAPTVLHLHSSKAGGVGRLAALGLRGLRVVYTPNGLATHLSQAFGFVERVLGHLRTDRLVAVSESEYREIAALGIVPRRNLTRIDSGISLDDTRKMAGPPSAPPEPTVLFVGRLTNQKDPLFAADASARVLTAVPTARFVWVGDGELRPEFTARLATLGITHRWTLVGWVDNPFPFVAASSVCALASRYESFGYVTLEAMALGKPMVATRVAGSSDLVESGETGFLVPLGDVVGFAEALTCLLSDSDMRDRMGTAALARAQSFTLERMARETLAMYTGS